MTDNETTIHDPRSMQNECYRCNHMRKIPGNCHIECRKFDEQMTGAYHAVVSGWFFYPFNFDPVWKEKFCRNFNEKSTHRSGQE